MRTGWAGRRSKQMRTGWAGRRSKQTRTGWAGRRSKRALRWTWLATQATSRFSSTLARPFVGHLWFTPWEVDTGDRARARHARWLGGTSAISIPYRGTQLTGFEAGDGPTVVLVHGWGERAATLGALVKPLVELGYRVVGIDMPAHGDSPGRRTNIPEEADALSAIVDHLGGAHAVIAHSMGGAVTTVSVSQGLDVDRVVLVGSAVRLEHALASFIKMVRLPARGEKAILRYIEKRFGKSVWEDFAADRLAKEINVPALIIHDLDDDQVAYEDGELLASCWPGARFVTTAGLGHMRVLGDGLVKKEIGEFLEGEVQALAG